MFESQLSRNQFIKIAAKIIAIASIGTQAGNCAAPMGIPPLKGISEEDYLGFRGIQRLFLDGNPIADFDLGIALDDYIYGNHYPIETEDLIRFLATIPNSVVLSLALDFSPTPLSKLNEDDLERRLLGWKNSSLTMKKGLYSILRQFTFFLITSDKRFQEFMGYKY